VAHSGSSPAGYIADLDYVVIYLNATTTACFAVGGDVVALGRADPLLGVLGLGPQTGVHLGGVDAVVEVQQSAHSGLVVVDDGVRDAIGNREELVVGH
jgi:hypothetical protein